MRISSNSKFKVNLFRIAAFTFSTSIILLIVEFVLRIVPIPGIGMGVGKYDPEINLYKFAPNSKTIRTNIRYERIVREVNSEGFLDKNHEKIKSDGVYRIGFFGDSYVESIQVLLDKTFFRLIENKLADFNVETLAFGRSGHGPVHSYLISNKYGEYYDLDMIVYVFYENDLGDQIEDIKSPSPFPYVELQGDKLLINDELLSNYVAKTSSTHNLREYVFYNNSILLQTLYRRFKLLQQYGISVSGEENNSHILGKVDNSKPPNSNDKPSTWNLKYKKRAVLLGEAVILKWSEEIRIGGRKFAILYVPSSQEWKKQDSEQDSWKYWLRNFCNNNQIDFIDPTNFFFKYDSLGKTIWDDHFSEEGHVAFASAFIEWYQKSKLE